MPKATFDKDGAVGVLTLSDPPLNLVSRPMLDDLEAALEQAHSAEVRCVLLCAEGEHFSAGADVGDMFRGRSAAEAHALLCRVGKVLSRCEQLPFPTLAAVQGLCLAGGLEMVLSCDLAIVAESAQLGLVEEIIGAIPFGGGAQRIAERAGSARAREIVMTSGLYDAATFERWNIVNRVVPDDDLRSEALRFAHRLASGPTRAHAATKRVVREWLDSGVRAADQIIPDVAAPLFETTDMKHGIDSLLEQGPGKAKFIGR